MARQLRATIVAQYPLPEGGKVSLTVLADSMNGEQYQMLAKIINEMIPLAVSLGWKPGADEAPAKPERPKRARPISNGSPAAQPPRESPVYPPLSAVPHAQEEPENGP